MSPSSDKNFNQKLARFLGFSINDKACPRTLADQRFSSNVIIGRRGTNFCLFLENHSGRGLIHHHFLRQICRIIDVRWTILKRVDLFHINVSTVVIIDCYARA